MAATDAGWQFSVEDPAYDGTFGIELFRVPETGGPIPLHAHPSPDRR